MSQKLLIQALLEQHSQKDVHAMMQRTLSGAAVTLEQVRTVRRNMLRQGAATRPKNVSLAHLQEVMPAPELVADPVEPQPVAIVLPGPAPRPAARPPETFESQMARIAAGARLIDAPDFRTPPPAYTLGGVASASL